MDRQFLFWRKTFDAAITIEEDNSSDCFMFIFFFNLHKIISYGQNQKSKYTNSVNKNNNIWNQIIFEK